MNLPSEQSPALSNPALNTPSLRRVPVKVLPAPDDRVRIADAIEKYIDACWAENNHVDKTVKVKAQELGRFAEYMRTTRKKEHVADLNRSDMLAYRDWMLKDGYMPWTVVGDLMGATTMLKKTPLLQVKGLLIARIGPTSPTPTRSRTRMRKCGRCWQWRSRDRVHREVVR